MLFKLVTPRIDRSMIGGVVEKWHKNVGDPISYGDDLLDIRVELMMDSPQGSLEQKIGLITDAEKLSDKDSARPMGERTIVLVARVTSSDVGVLRRIEAPEGSYREIGSLLAILSSDESEPVGGPGRDLAGASEFRMVVNVVE